VPALLGVRGSCLVVASLVVAAAAVVGVFQLYLAIRVAPNNWDSMAYHMSRAA
jgi:hypothetical protein